jgi:hypothetical protein
LSVNNSQGCKRVPQDFWGTGILSDSWTLTQPCQKQLTVLLVTVTFLWIIDRDENQDSRTSEKAGSIFETGE